jgi:hypothetical protein
MLRTDRTAPTNIIWEPLRVAIAWSVTNSDLEFVDWVRSDPHFDNFDPANNILVDCLRKELIGHWRPPDAAPSGPLIVRGEETVQINTGIIPTSVSRKSDADKFYVPKKCLVGGQEILSEQYTGRLKQLAEEFDAARGARPKGILRLEEYLLGRFDQALADILKLIECGKLPAKGIPMRGGVEAPLRKITPFDVNGSMRLGIDGVLYQSANKGAPAWKSIEVSWADFMHCHGGAAAESTAARTEQALSGMTAPEEATASTEQGRERSTLVPAVLLTKGSADPVEHAALSEVAEEGAPGPESLYEMVHQIDRDLFPKGPPKGLRLSERRRRILGVLKKNGIATHITDRTFQRYGIKRNTRKPHAYPL